MILRNRLCSCAKALAAPAAAICVSLIVAGCGFIGTEPPVTVIAKFSAADDAQVAAAAEILRKRFDEFRPHINSKLSVSREADSFRFYFQHGAPSPQVIMSLLNTKGRLRVFLKEHPIETWITERDVVAATVVEHDKTPALAIRVGESGAKRLRERTSKYIGQIVTTTIDNQPVLEATVQGVFSDSFQITNMDYAQLLTLKSALAYGVLPLEIQTVRIQ